MSEPTPDPPRQSALRSLTNAAAVQVIRKAAVSAGTAVVGAVGWPVILSVAAVVVRHHPVPMRILGVTGFAPTGSAEFLLNHFHLDADGIVAAVRELRG